MIDVVVNGTGKLGIMVFHLLSADERYRVVAFTADRQYCGDDTLLGLPLVPHDDIVERYPPDRVTMLSVLGGLGGSQARRDHFSRARDLGYTHGNYVHPTALVQGSQRWGVNNIVFPFTVVGFDGVLGDDNILREKAYLGHDFVVGDHTFLGVGCSVGGGLRLGSGAYVAMGTTVTNDVTIGDGAFVGIGSLVLRDVAAHTRVLGRPARPADRRAAKEPMTSEGLLPLLRHSDARGHLVAVTAGLEVPFPIRRVFYIFGNTAGLPRAGHAHPSMTELLISVAGSCRATLEDASGIRTVVLDRPDIGVLVPPMTWLQLTDFTPDCVLLAICDQEHRSDAISDRAAYAAAIE